MPGSSLAAGNFASQLFPPPKMGLTPVMSLVVATILVLSVLLVHYETLIDLVYQSSADCSSSSTAAGSRMCPTPQQQKSQQQQNVASTNRAMSFNDSEWHRRRFSPFFGPELKRLQNGQETGHKMGGALMGKEGPKLARPLRIAQIAPMIESVPPKMYGGTERIVHYLTEELVRMGHQVTLFCSADSESSAEMVVHKSWPAIRLNPVVDQRIPVQWMLEQVRKQADDFDVLHFHITEQFNMIHPFMDRTVTTLHGKLDFPDMSTLFETFPDVPLVSISDDQRTHVEFRDSNFVGTVHHGVPSTLLPFTAQPSHEPGRPPYLAFLGRITEDKRPDWAIQIAVAAGIPLKIAAKVDPVDVQYWEAEIRPLVEQHPDLVEYIGEINDTEKGEFLGNARALLFPIDWHEPFGLVMIESMACGTPIVARRRGSVAEVIEHGVSGLTFETMEEAVEAVKEVHLLDRAAVRQAFEERFTVQKMAQNYVKLYEKMREQNERKKKVAV